MSDELTYPAKSLIVRLFVRYLRKEKCVCNDNYQCSRCKTIDEMTEHFPDLAGAALRAFAKQTGWTRDES